MLNIYYHVFYFVIQFRLKRACKSWYSVVIDFLHNVPSFLWFRLYINVLLINYLTSYFRFVIFATLRTNLLAREYVKGRTDVCELYQKLMSDLSSHRKMAPKSSLCRMTLPIAWFTARNACCLYHCCPDRYCAYTQQTVRLRHWDKIKHVQCSLSFLSPSAQRIYSCSSHPRTASLRWLEGPSWEEKEGQ